jgi:lipid-binding SYLF domain-containing protein
MQALLGFELDLWDYLTFLTLMLCVVAVITLWIFLAGLPGRIALSRKHPEAEAVKLLGFAGLLPTVYPWVQASLVGVESADRSAEYRGRTRQVAWSPASESHQVATGARWQLGGGTCDHDGGAVRIAVASLPEKEGLAGESILFIRASCQMEIVMKTPVLLLVAALGFGSSPGFAAEWSWDPLKDAENVLPAGVPNEGKIIQARHQVREMAQDALATLYELQPGARQTLESSAGYAVFSTFGIKLFFAGGTTGKGVVVNQLTNRQTFMQMAQVQGGLGFGVNKNRLIFVFANQPALSNFVNQGWEFGAQANLSVMAGGQGGMYSGAISVAPGVYLYQLTDTGLSATLTVSGTRFFKDTSLN